MSLGSHGYIKIHYKHYNSLVSLFLHCQFCVSCWTKKRDVHQNVWHLPLCVLQLFIRMSKLVLYSFWSGLSEHILRMVRKFHQKVGLIDGWEIYLYNVIYFGDKHYLGLWWIAINIRKSSWRFANICFHIFIILFNVTWKCAWYVGKIYSFRLYLLYLVKFS